MPMIIGEKGDGTPVPFLLTGRRGGQRREVALLSACLHVWTRYTNHKTSPRTIAPGILRCVANRVLARQFVVNLPVDAGEDLRIGREERAAAGVIAKLAKRVGRLAEPF